jgi:hypothetical protein
MEKVLSPYHRRRETDQRSETVRGPGDSQKIELLRRLSYHSQLGNSRSRIIPIDLESNPLGKRTRDLRHRDKYRA